MLVQKNARKFLGGVTSALAIRRPHRPAHALQNDFNILEKDQRKEGREGQVIGRKEKRKHPSRRAEAIRNAC